MSPRLVRHLRDAVPVIVFFVIVALTWDNVRWYLAPEDGPREPLTVMFLGVLLALPLIVLESSALASRSLLDLPAELTAEPMGAVALRGVGEPLEIVAFS